MQVLAQAIDYELIALQPLALCGLECYLSSTAPLPGHLLDRNDWRAILRLVPSAV